MKIEASNPEEYIAQIPEERKEAFRKLREEIKNNLPDGFEETMSYGMLGYVVPHSLYPAGYHCDPSLPLPFINLANQKNFIAVYNSAIYADEDILNWFVSAYKERVGRKPDMGKSCIRFKNMEKIPYDLIGALARKITPQQWIEKYESR